MVKMEMTQYKLKNSMKLYIYPEKDGMVVLKIYSVFNRKILETKVDAQYAFTVLHSTFPNNPELLDYYYNWYNGLKD